MAKNDDKPVMDSGELPGPRPAPYHAGGPQGSLADRKRALLGSGRPGFTPRGTGRAGHVYETPPPPTPGDELEPAPRPMPREQPVSSTPTHTGNIVRYLDGHSEVHRERPGLVELLSNEHVHPDDKEDIRTEIAHRDAIHSHKYW